MKKSIKKIIALVLVVVLVCTLTACATSLNGTYVNKNGIIEQSFTFMKDNKVKISAFDLDLEGEYAIEDDQIIFTYSLLGIGVDLPFDFEKDGSSIFINGVEFVKEK